MICQNACTHRVRVGALEDDGLRIDLHCCGNISHRQSVAHADCRRGRGEDADGRLAVGRGQHGKACGSEQRPDTRVERDQGGALGGLVAG